jgi:hypothetical protein
MSASVDTKGNSDRSFNAKGLGSKATLPQATSPWTEWDQHAIKHPLLELCQCLTQLAVPFVVVIMLLASAALHGQPPAGSGSLSDLLKP